MRPRRLFQRLGGRREGGGYYWTQKSETCLTAGCQDSALLIWSQSKRHSRFQSYVFQLSCPVASLRGWGRESGEVLFVYMPHLQKYVCEDVAVMPFLYCFFFWFLLLVVCKSRCSIAFFPPPHTAQPIKLTSVFPGEHAFNEPPYSSSLSSSSSYFSSSSSSSLFQLFRYSQVALFPSSLSGQSEMWQKQRIRDSLAIWWIK